MDKVVRYGKDFRNSGVFDGEFMGLAAVSSRTKGLILQPGDRVCML